MRRHSFDLAASAPGMIVRGIAAMTRVAGGRRKEVGRVAAARHPGRLRLLHERSLFPQTIGSLFTFAVTDDPDAVVRLRVDESTGDLGAALDAAVADALAKAAGFRALAAVFAGHGFPVVALEPDGLVPGVAAPLTDGNAATALAAIGAAARAWTRERTPPGGAVRVAILASVPATGDADLPTPLRLARVPAAVAAPRHIASYPVVDGVAEDTPSTVYVRRDHRVRAAFEERVLAQASAWLREERPGAVTLRTAGSWPLLPGRVAEATGHVLVADHRGRAGRRVRPDHALAMTVDLDGATTAPPGLLLDVRDARGAVRLPPPPAWRA